MAFEHGRMRELKDEMDDGPASPISASVQKFTDCNSMFQMLDTNGNGVLERGELMRGLTDLGVRDEMIEAIFIHMDEVLNTQCITTVLFLLGVTRLHCRMRADLWTNLSLRCGMQRFLLLTAHSDCKYNL